MSEEWVLYFRESKNPIINKQIKRHKVYELIKMIVYAPVIFCLYLLN